MSGFETSVTIDRETASLDCIDGVMKVEKRSKLILARVMKKPFCICSKELPPAFGQAGDLILQDSNGGLHVCRSDVFDQIYEVVG